MQPTSVFKGCWVPSPALSGSHKGWSSVGWEGMTLEDFGSECLCVYLCMHQVCPAKCVCMCGVGVCDVLVCMSVFAYDPMCSLAQVCMHAHVVFTGRLCTLKGVPASQLRVTMIWSRTGTNMREKTNGEEKAEKWHRRAERLFLNPVLQILQTHCWSHKSMCLFRDAHFMLRKCSLSVWSRSLLHLWDALRYWKGSLKGSSLELKCFILWFYHIRANYYPGGLCCLQKLSDESPKASTHVRIKLTREACRYDVSVL